MARMTCAREASATRAVRSGVWPGALRDHVNACASCREAVLVSAALQPLAAEPAAGTGLPDAAWLWRKALLEEKHVEASRTRRPLLVAEFLPMSSCLVALVAAVALYWPGVETQLVAWQADLWSLARQGLAWLPADVSSFPAGRLPVGFVVLGVVVAAATYPLLAEE